MKITKIETVRLTSRPTLIWVRVHTDEGLIGLGESWFGCAAVDADIHERIAPALIGADPSRIEALTRATRPYVGFCGTGAEIRAASAIHVALWDISEFIRTRLLSITLVVGFGFLLMASLILDAGLTWVGTYLEASFSGFTVILQILNSAIAFGIAALSFAMIFKILPAVPLTWRDVGMGAAMTALLFMAGKFVIGYYIGKSGVASAYGAAASIITLLLWIYYSSLILLFGAEFTRAYAENRGSRTEVAQG